MDINNQEKLICIFEKEELTKDSAKCICFFFVEGRLKDDTIQNLLEMLYLLHIFFFWGGGMHMSLILSMCVLIVIPLCLKENSQ